MLTNYHTHSVFCDGKDTPEEMALRAIHDAAVDSEISEEDLRNASRRLLEQEKGAAVRTIGFAV